MTDLNAMRNSIEDPDDRLRRYIQEARAFSANYDRACSFLDMCLLRDVGALWALFDANGYAEVRAKLLGAAPGG
jgi:hypothetical protein